MLSSLTNSPPPSHARSNCNASLRHAHKPVDHNIAIDINDEVLLMKQSCQRVETLLPFLQDMVASESVDSDTWKLALPGSYKTLRVSDAVEPSRWLVHALSVYQATSSLQNDGISSNIDYNSDARLSPISPISPPSTPISSFSSPSTFLSDHSPRTSPASTLSTFSLTNFLNVELDSLKHRVVRAHDKMNALLILILTLNSSIQKLLRNEINVPKFVHLIQSASAGRHKHRMNLPPHMHYYETLYSQLKRHPEELIRIILITAPIDSDQAIYLILSSIFSDQYSQIEDTRLLSFLEALLRELYALEICKVKKRQKSGLFESTYESCLSDSIFQLFRENSTSIRLIVGYCGRGPVEDAFKRILRPTLLKICELKEMDFELRPNILKSIFDSEDDIEDDIKKKVNIICRLGDEILERLIDSTSSDDAYSCMGPLSTPLTAVNSMCLSDHRSPLTLPYGIRYLVKYIYDLSIKEAKLSQTVALKLVGCFFFLRILNPIILSLGCIDIGIDSSILTDNSTQSKLIILSKLLQHSVNCSSFGDDSGRDIHLQVLNDWIHANHDKINSFVIKLINVVQLQTRKDAVDRIFAAGLEDHLDVVYTTEKDIHDLIQYFNKYKNDIHKVELESLQKAPSHVGLRRSKSDKIDSAFDTVLTVVASGALEYIDVNNTERICLKLSRQVRARVKIADSKLFPWSTVEDPDIVERKKYNFSDRQLSDLCDLIVQLPSNLCDEENLLNALRLFREQCSQGTSDMNRNCVKLCDRVRPLIPSKGVGTFLAAIIVAVKDRRGLMQRLCSESQVILAAARHLSCMLSVLGAQYDSKHCIVNSALQLHQEFVGKKNT